jgi:hypothetical protein
MVIKQTPVPFYRDTDDFGYLLVGLSIFRINF